MELEEAVNKLKANIKTPRFAYIGVNGMAVCQGLIGGPDAKEAIDTVLQELEHLQNENKGLISEKTKLLLTDLSEANKLYDEENKRCMMFAIENNDLKEKLDNSISKDKIREKIKEIYEDKNSEYHDMFLEQRDIEKTISILKDLLKEE